MAEGNKELFNPADPEGGGRLIDWGAADAMRDAYEGRTPDLIGAAGEDLFLPAEGHEDLVTHVIGGVCYVQRGPDGVPTGPPTVICHEGSLYSCVQTRNEWEEVWPGREDMTWHGRGWYLLDKEYMRAMGVSFSAGRLVSEDGSEVVESDYAAGL